MRSRIRTAVHLLPAHSYFTDGIAAYGHATSVVIDETTPLFRERDCVYLSVRDGSCDLEVNTELYHLQPGSFCVLHTFHVFRFLIPGGEALRLEVFIFPYPVMVHLDLTKPLNRSMQDDYCPVCSAFTDADRRSLDEMLALYKEESDAPRQASRLLQNLLQSHIYWLYHASVTTVNRARPLEARIFEYMAFHSMEELSADKIAALFDLSKSDVKRAVTAVTGSSFSEALNYARASNAYSMILRRGLALDRLYRLAGFSSESTFLREFKRVYGDTPSAVRNKLRQDVLGCIEEDDRFMEIQSYLLANFREDISILTCSKALFLSQKAIRDVICSKYGSEVTFKKILTGVRLRYAAGLLVSGNAAVRDIAYDAGFSSVHTFIRQFTGAYKMTPTKIREIGSVPPVL